jgi:prepilin-type N-terminal cleavage/methylation domain-containing protein/prepilin-type processing-associated H-X9-DG protein
VQSKIGDVNKKAFTLIELLVVAAIIGILASFLLPTIGKVRRNAKKAVCINNLRQIGVATYMYIDEHTHKFPRCLTSVEPDHLWYHDLEPYIDDREIFNCPSYKYHDYGNRDYFSYGFNYMGLNYNDNGVFYGDDINDVIEPSQCIMISAGLFNPLEKDQSFFLIYKEGILPPRHSNGTNILFVDSHISWYLISDIPMSGSESIAWWNY